MFESTFPGEAEFLRVFVGTAANGKPAFETIVVEPLPNGSYRLLKTPKFALGVASGDVVHIGEDQAISHVLDRGNNWAVQVVAKDAMSPELIARLTRIVSKHGGTFDVHDHIMAGCAVPKTAGFADLESDLDELVNVGLVKSWWTGDLEPLVSRDPGP